MNRSQDRRILAKADKLTFEDVYGEISEAWEQKARALQARRWRALKQEMKGGH